MKPLYQYLLLTFAFWLAMSQTINNNGVIEPIELIKMAITGIVYLGTVIMYRISEDKKINEERT